MRPTYLEVNLPQLKQNLEAICAHSRQQLIDKQIISFQIMSAKKPLEQLRISETITVNSVVFELTQIVNYNLSNHFTTSFWLSVIEATYLGDSTLAGTYHLDAMNDGGMQYHICESQTIFKTMPRKC